MHKEKGKNDGADRRSHREAGREKDKSKVKEWNMGDNGYREEEHDRQKDGVLLGSKKDLRFNRSERGGLGQRTAGRRRNKGGKGKIKEACVFRHELKFVHTSICTTFDFIHDYVLVGCVCSLCMRVTASDGLWGREWEEC